MDWPDIRKVSQDEEIRHKWLNVWIISSLFILNLCITCPSIPSSLLGEQAVDIIAFNESE